MDLSITLSSSSFATTAASQSERPPISKKIYRQDRAVNIGPTEVPQSKRKSITHKWDLGPSLRAVFALTLSLFRPRRTWHRVCDNAIGLVSQSEGCTPYQNHWLSIYSECGKENTILRRYQLTDVTKTHRIRRFANHASPFCLSCVTLQLTRPASPHSGGLIAGYLGRYQDRHYRHASYRLCYTCPDANDAQMRKTPRVAIRTQAFSWSACS